MIKGKVNKACTKAYVKENKCKRKKKVHAFILEKHLIHISHEATPNWIGYLWQIEIRNIHKIKAK